MHRYTFKALSVTYINYLLALLNVQKQPNEDYVIIPILHLKKTDFSQGEWLQISNLKNSNKVSQKTHGRHGENPENTVYK